MAGTQVISVCPACSERTALPPHKYRLNRCTNKTGRDFYSWVCPACDTPVAKYAGLHEVALLTAASVPSILYACPLEMDDAQRRDGGVLSADDVLDFHLALADWDGEVQWQN